MSMSNFPHLNADGAARLVDISEKPATRRHAVAKSRISMAEETAWALRSATGQPLPGDPNDHAGMKQADNGAFLHPELKKGDCFPIARIAAIQAAKNACQWIPLCHMIPLDAVDVSYAWLSKNELEWTVSVTATWKTGVEMEALAGASAAALTTYDMCKAIDRSMEITQIALWSKSGGKSGDYHRCQEENMQ